MQFVGRTCPAATYRRPRCEASLRRRGDLTVWFSEAAIAAWHAKPRSSRGGQSWHSPFGHSDGADAQDGVRPRAALDPRVDRLDQQHGIEALRRRQMADREARRQDTPLRAEIHIGMDAETGEFVAGRADDERCR